mgnify:CR=1 FL=1
MKSTKHIDGFCSVHALTETYITDNGEYGEDRAVLYTALEVNSGHRVWYMEDSDGYRVPITGLAKQNCAIVLSLNTTPRRLLADIAEIRGHCRPHEYHWITDRIRETEKRIYGS